MLITYFDEVKCDNEHQPYYWLGGLTVTPEAIWRLEQELSAVAKQYFGDEALTRDTEFHAADIFHRKRHFKDWNDLPKRLDRVKRLATILDEEQEVAKIYVRLAPSKMIAADFEIKAFVFFVELVHQHLQAKGAPGILIGDRENEKVSGIFAESLSRLRRDGTPYRFGIKLKYLIDTVHFTNSHHSRMLQLADLYVWLIQLCHAGDQENPPRKTVVDHVRKTTKLLTPTLCKVWPTDQSWLSRRTSHTLTTRSSTLKPQSIPTNDRPLLEATEP